MTSAPLVQEPPDNPDTLSRLPRTGPAPLYLPRSVLRGRLTIPDADRVRGIAIRAGSGSGKSVFLGRVLCFQSLLRFVPQVVLDPHGPLVDNILLAVGMLPLEVRQRLWPRVKLIDMSGKGPHVVSFPLLYRLQGEGLRDVADRVLETFRKLDPHLQGASIQGWNALVSIGRPVLMVLAALDEPISEAESLLRQPDIWEERLNEACRRHPEVQPAVAFLREEILLLRPQERLDRARSFLVKLAPFALDPVMAGMFCSPAPGIDLDEVVASRTTVLLDFRDETNAERRRFKTRWIFEWFMAYVKARGAGQNVPLGFVVDELTELTNRVTLGEDLFGGDLDEMINVYGRNYGLNLAMATQEQHQLPQATQNALLTMGTQVMGVTANMETAKQMAEQFFALDPYRVKRLENVWGSGGFGSVVVEEREAFMPVDEQVLLGAQVLLSLRPFQFLVKKKDSRHLTTVSTKRFVDGIWPGEVPEAIHYIRRQLVLRDRQRADSAAGGLSLPPTCASGLDTMEATIHDADDSTYTTDEIEEGEAWTTGPLW